MDKLDSQLLQLLSINARESTSALARRLGVSRSTVQSRMSSLERRNVIAGYTIRYHDDYSRHRISAHVLLCVDPKQSAQVVIQLKKMAAVNSLLAISGAYDLIAMLESATTEEIDAVLDQIGALPGIEKTNSSIVLSTKFDRKA